MQLFADSWLREARDRISSCQPAIGAGAPTPADLETLADAAEKAIKAALIECHGSIPDQYNADRLVTTCQKTGLWDVLPPALRKFVQGVDHSAFTNTSELKTAQAPIDSYFCIAPRFIDYIEQHVIGNHSVLKRLSVA